MRDKGREERTGKGRHRGVWKSDDDLLREAEAKGNYDGISHEPGLAHEQTKITEDGERMRHQKGDGTNQKHESPKKTAHQSRAAGAERAESNRTRNLFE